jgi:maltooligosyltrehalose trehalohydrolase
VTEGRAREFASFAWAGEVPDPQAVATFERSKLDWSEVVRPPHAGLLDWYRRLIAIRGERSGRNIRAKPKVKFDARAEWLRFEHARVLAVFNLAAAAQRVPLPAGSWDLALASDPQSATASSDMPARATRVYRRRE